jgi:hypothetical protein
LVSALNDRFVLEFDMTAEKENSISAENIDYIKSIENEVDVIVCATEETYISYMASMAEQTHGLTSDATTSDYINQTLTLINKYGAYNKKIKVQFVDTQSSEFTAITSKYGTNNLEFGSIIVSVTKADGTLRYKKLGFKDIYALTEDDTYAAYGMVTSKISGNNIETALTGAISYVLSDIDVKVAFLTGHSSNDLTASYKKLLTDNNYENAIDRLADSKRDILCIQVLTREELNPQMRGKMHLFDSENVGKTYRKNIDRDIIRAYKEALQFVQDRIREYCASRGADYMLVAADETMAEVFFEKLVGTGVLK